MSYLALRGLLMPNGQVLCQLCLPSPTGRAANDAAGPLKVLLYRKDRVLLRWGVRLDLIQSRTKPASLPAGVPVHFHTRFPMHPDADRIVLLNEDIELWQTPVPQNAPQFEGDVAAEMKRGELRLSWRAHHDDGLALRYYVRMSVDRGLSWKRLASNLDKPSCAIKQADLASGEPALLEIIASDGFHRTATTVRLKPLPPALEVIMLSPVGPRVGGGPVRLEALAQLRGRPGALDDKAVFVWTADQAKIAEGRLAWWHQPNLIGPADLAVHVECQGMKASTSRPINFAAKAANGIRKGKAPVR